MPIVGGVTIGGSKKFSMKKTTQPKHFKVPNFDNLSVGWLIFPPHIVLSSHVMPFRRGISWALLFQMSKHLKGNEAKLKKTKPFLAILCNFLGMVKWPFTRLSDLKLKNQNEMHEFTKKMSYRFGDWTSATLGCPSYRIVEVSKICSFLPTLGKWSNLTFAYVSNWVRSTAN